MAEHDPAPLVSHLRWMLSAEQSPELSDGQLLDRYVKGHDAVAFAALVRRHGQLVLGVSRRVLHRVHDAEDVFQATFLILARKAGSIRRHEAVGSWLYQTAWRLAHKLRRREEQQRTLQQLAASLPQADPLAEVSWREVRAVLDEELARLPDKNRGPLLLCCFEGLTLEEAARRLGWPVRTLQARLANARKLLRGRLARRGLPVGSAMAATLLAGDGALAHVPAPVAVATCQAAVLSAAGDTWAGTISNSAGALAKGAMKDMVIASILKTAAVAVLCAGLIGGGIGYFIGRAVPTAEENAPVVAIAAVLQNEQPKKDQATTKQVTYTARNRAAADLAGLLARHFKGIDGVRISADRVDNTLELAASPDMLDELTNALAKLDRKPGEIDLQIFFISLPAPAGMGEGEGDFDVQQLIGQADRVLATIDANQKKGVFSSVERFQLKVTANQQATLDNPRSMPYTTGARSAGDKITRTVAYKNVGSAFKLTAKISPTGLVELDINAQRSTGQDASNVPISSFPNGEVVKATEFSLATLDSHLSVARGQAVLARDARWTTNKAGERLLMVIAAQTIP
jgi:RNA polymerase sigma factor (sigma-70 family)